MNLTPDLFATLAWTIGIVALISIAARSIHLIFFERYFKLTFEDAPVWSLFYFGGWTAVIALLFTDELKDLFGAISFSGYLILTLCLMVVFPFVYKILHESVGSPKWLAEIFPGQGMLSLEERYIVAKIGDVVFQQSAAGALIVALSAHGVSYPNIVFIFVALFAVAHLYIFRTAGFFWGLHYTAYATLGGFAFPFLILFVPGGIGYAILLHMLFYVLSAAFFAKMPHAKNATISRELVGVASPRIKG